MTGRRERTYEAVIQDLHENEVVVLGKNGGAYLFSRNDRGTVRLNRFKSFDIERTEIPTMREKATELLKSKGAFLSKRQG